MMLKEKHAREENFKKRKKKHSLVKWVQKPTIYTLITFQEELLNLCGRTIVIKCLVCSNIGGMQKIRAL